MHIAIVGAGWYGLHIGLTLKEIGHRVTIFEKSPNIFSGASSNNQNRFHHGFHYPRSDKTRKQIQLSFVAFMKRYGGFLETVTNNIYAVADNSIIDFGTYCNNYKQDYFNIVDDYYVVNSSVFGLKNIEGAVVCGEKLINVRKLRAFFEKCLHSELVLGVEVASIVNVDNGVLVNGNFYDFCIICTYHQSLVSFLGPDSPACLYEACIMLVYEKIKDVLFGALTIVDGHYFSIYPYYDNLYTLSSVIDTPMFVSDRVENANHFLASVNLSQIDNIRAKMESGFSYFCPPFRDSFNYKYPIMSMKTKPRNSSSDAREFNYIINKRICGCFAGKINHVVLAEWAVKRAIEELH